MQVKLTTDTWRERKAEEKRERDAGEISADECILDQLFPDAFIDRTEHLLRVFASSIEGCSTLTNDYPKVMKTIEALVVALNKVNEDFDHKVIETGEREELCDFVDQVLIAKGIDIEDLAAFHGCEANALTDEWRDW